MRDFLTVVASLSCIRPRRTFCALSQLTPCLVLNALIYTKRSALSVHALADEPDHDGEATTPT
jgi:hypothetical protein